MERMTEARFRATGLCGEKHSCILKRLHVVLGTSLQSRSTNSKTILPTAKICLKETMEMRDSCIKGKQTLKKTQP